MSLPGVIIVPGWLHSGFLATRGLGRAVCLGLTKAYALLVGGLSQGVGGAAQMPGWAEPVLMLVLGVALLVAAQGIRQWARRKIKL